MAPTSRAFRHSLPTCGPCIIDLDDDDSSPAEAIGQPPACSRSAPAPKTKEARGPEGVALAWAVLRPGQQRSAGFAPSRELACRAPPQPKTVTDHPAKRPRLASRKFAGAEPVAAVRVLGDGDDTSQAAERLRERAASILQEALGSEAAKTADAGAVVEQQVAADAAATAAAMADRCIKLLGVKGARRHLLSLASALRVNAELRREVLAAGPKSAGELVARQDPRSWASAELRGRRRQWLEESMRDVKPAGPVGTCPECGGRAVVACGTAGSGRSGRLTKSFAHYSCLEDRCGRQSHVKQE